MASRLRPPGRAPRRALAGVALVVFVVLGRAAPAAADPPAPTDYRSTVDALDPAADGVHAEVVGGDAFLELTVDAGHEVVVDGYQHEPYLRFRTDGTVERNRRSPATYVNESRDGAVDVPEGLDEADEPEWETVAEGGSYSWHDHRVHWMGGERPVGAEPGEWSRPWTVDLVVDGTPTRITGTLALVDGVNPVPWAALAVAGASVVVLLGRRRPAAAAAVAALAACAIAAVVGWAQHAAAPAGSGASPLLVAVPLAGVVAAAIGLGLALREPARPQRWRATASTTATLAAAGAAAGWSLLRLEVLWKPVLPTQLSYGLDRAGTALALGLAVAAAGLAVWARGLPAQSEARAAAIAGGGGRR